jgi:hypothetical protein
MNEFFQEQGRVLEDEFFAKQDAILLQQLKELQQMEQTQKALSAVSGIKDEKVLKHLIELGIKPELLATLTLVPLVETAWADGSVQEGERRAILEGATRNGLGPGSVDYVLLDEWLKQRPPEKMMEAWTVYIRGLCKALPPEERDLIKSLFITRARKVAESAGGFLGLTSKISAKEEAMLKQLEAAFSN